jgi:hypothetical protein
MNEGIKMWNTYVGEEVYAQTVAEIVANADENINCFVDHINQHYEPEVKANRVHSSFDSALIKHAGGVTKKKAVMLIGLFTVLIGLLMFLSTKYAPKKTLTYNIIGLVILQLIFALVVYYT